MFPIGGLITWEASQLEGRTPFLASPPTYGAALSRWALSAPPAYLIFHVQTHAGRRRPLPRAFRQPDDPGPLLGTGAPSVLKNKVAKIELQKSGRV